MKYFDFHLHSVGADSVFNVIIGKDEIPGSGYFTAGIHPWFIDHIADQLSELKEIITHKNCIAIGECGLDRLKGPDISIQKDIFKSHIELADDHKKPLIIHCVKAHNELLEIKKQSGSTVKWIVHGFNQNETIARRLLENDFLFSLGKPLLHPDSNGSKVIKQVPLSRLFLETDSAEVTIEEVYKAAAERLALPMLDLSDNLQRNFQRIFLHE